MEIEDRALVRIRWFDPMRVVGSRSKEERYGNCDAALRPIGHGVPAVSPRPRGPGLPDFRAANRGEAYTLDPLILPDLRRHAFRVSQISPKLPRMCSEHPRLHHGSRADMSEERHRVEPAPGRHSTSSSTRWRRWTGNTKRSRCTQPDRESPLSYSRSSIHTTDRRNTIRRAA